MTTADRLAGARICAEAEDSARGWLVDAVRRVDPDARCDSRILAP